jgi:signal transduction histidine kinase
MGRFIAHLEDAAVAPIDRGNVDYRAIRTDLKTALTGAHDADLIELEAELREVVRARDGVTLLMRGGPVVFPARLEPPAAAAFDPPRIGSVLRLTGVCSVAQSASRATGFSTRPVAFDLLLRSPADVAVVRAAPWWTARKLGVIALGAFGLAALALAWAALLRRQVRRQTEVIAEQLQGEAVAEERQRIAREFHDTLEQELVALSLRLDTATAKASEGPVRGLLQGCRRLVQRLQSEGRDFIWDLREHSTPPEALRHALEEAAGALCDGDETVLAVSLEGEPRVLKGALAHALVRVAQEACSNAIRHGRARHVRISVRFGESEVRLRVEDDGAGFLVTDPPSAAPGHFGLLGMRERMQKAGGQLTVQSALEKGTVVEAAIPFGLK